MQAISNACSASPAALDMRSLSTADASIIENSTCSAAIGAAVCGLVAEGVRALLELQERARHTSARAKDAGEFTFGDQADFVGALQACRPHFACTSFANLHVACTAFTPWLEQHTLELWLIITMAHLTTRVFTIVPARSCWL